MSDMVNHPPHYTSHPSGVEAITITEHMSFCVGNAIKYLWRAGDKGDTIQDLEKARWYVDREIQRLTNPSPEPEPKPEPALSFGDRVTLYGDESRVGVVVFGPDRDGDYRVFRSDGDWDFYAASDLEPVVAS